MEYTDFIQSKIKVSKSYGFNIHPDEVSSIALPHQRDMVVWALERGRCLIAASFGLGKSLVQIEIAKIIVQRFNASFLFICPLGVKHQFTEEDGKMLGVDIKYVRNTDEFINAGTPFCITNYERVRDDNFDIPRLIRDYNLQGMSMDEGSVLRSLGSDTTQKFIQLFENINYKFVATATPAPNEYLEIVNYADFLGVMDRGQALTRFFQRDSQKAGNLTLHPHHEEAFWTWVSSWALFLTKPSDLGYSDNGYSLPKMNVTWHEISVPPEVFGELKERDGQLKMMADAASSLVEAAKIKRATVPARLEKAASLMNDTDHYLLWHLLEDERKAIEKQFPEIKTVFGSQSLEIREERILDFTHGRFRVLATKPEIAGSGCNFQRHCHNAIFMSIDYKFNDFIQAVHRIYRFLQDKSVNIHIIYTAEEKPVADALKRKWAQHDKLLGKMRAIIKKYGLDHRQRIEDMKRSIGAKRREVKTTRYTAIKNDCVLEMPNIKSNSVGLVHTSIPFGNHYEYSASYNDFGHNEDNAVFWKQMDYLIPELHRVLMPGRNAIIHVKDRIRYNTMTGLGSYTIDPFSDECTTAFRKHGFLFIGRITIVTDVVRENNQTYRLGWTEKTKDASKMGAGLPEYLLLFRKQQTDLSKGFADDPVTRDKSTFTRAKWQTLASSYWRSSGNRMIKPEDIAGWTLDRIIGWFKTWSMEEIYDFGLHTELGEAIDNRRKLPSTFMALANQSKSSHVWTDVNYMHGLNAEQNKNKTEKHICLATGTLILTKRGYIPIEDVEIGDNVLTHLGRWKPVIAKEKTGFGKDVVQVHAQGVPNLVLTPTHKLWTRLSKPYRERATMQKAEPCWVEASKTKQHYLNLKTPPEMASDLTAKDWWIVGRWLADGHIDFRGHQYFISVGNHKLDHFEEMAGEYIGAMNEKGSVTQIGLKGLPQQTRDMLAKCGKGATNKHLPLEAISLSKELSEALLSGYLSGDGHIDSRGGWHVSSVSRPLLLGMAIVAQKARNVVVSVYAGKKAGNHTIEGRKVKAQQLWVLMIAPRNRSGIILDDGGWKKVSKVEPKGISDVWNIRVQDDESYTAEGCIVKNCPLPFDIVERVLDCWSKEGDVVLDPFAGLFTVPYTAVKMNRIGIGIELNEDYYKSGLNYMKKADHDVSIPTLFDLIDEMENPKIDVNVEPEPAKVSGLK